MSRILSLLFALLTFAASVFASPADQTKPNILFILSDDQRWDSLGCYGNTVVRSPNLDKLAAQGARLDAFYVASPLCCPSRAVFLTGYYPHQSGILANTGDPGGNTIAKLFNEGGYLTGFVGKAHLGGNPNAWSFKECPLYFPGGETKYENPELVVNGKKQVVPGNITNLFADSAIRFLEEHRSERWFLWLATTAPHGPNMKDPNFVYEASKIIAPPGWPSGQEFRPGHFETYYPSISVMDREIGRVLKKLDDLGLSSNTFVFFASDNGWMMGSHQLSGKSVWYEESIRVPALARWPGKIKPGTRVPYLLSSVDFVPTILDIAGLHQPSELEGKSMLPALINAQSVRSAVFSEVRENNDFWQMVRTDQWKYVHLLMAKKQSPAPKPDIIYNLKTDPYELKDLSESPADAGALQQMKQQLDFWLKKTEQGPKRPVSSRPH